MVFQNYAIFPHLSVKKNVEFGLKNKHFPKDQIAERTQKFLKLMQIDHLADRFPDRLSGGQQQRVLLARALCAAKKLLVLDEPVKGFDPAITKAMYDDIADLNKNGMTVIMISHDINASEKYASKILELKRERGDNA